MTSLKSEWNIEKLKHLKKETNKIREKVKKSRIPYYKNRAYTYTETMYSVKARKGFVRVISNGEKDITIVTDQGKELQLPIIRAKWELEPNELPKIIIELPAEVDLDGVEIKATKNKKSIPIEEFMNENDHSRE